MSPNSHYFGQGRRKCTWIVSKMETRWLDSLNIPKEQRNFRLPGLGRCNVDGYVTHDDGSIECFEFFGSYWHGDLRVFDKNDYNKVTKCTFGELHEKTLSKEKLILAQGYRLTTMWEKDFIEIEKSNKKK